MKWHRSRGFRAIVLLILFILGGIFLQAYSQVEKPQLVNTQGRSFEKATVLQVTQDNLQENGSRVGDQIVTLCIDGGEHKGQTVTANCPNGLLFGTVCQPGMDVIVISSRVGQVDVNTVYNVDRTWPIVIFVGSFLLLLCLIGGRKGARSAIALIFTFICFVYLFFPMILRGLSPILASIVTSLIIMAATIYLINGWTRKSLAALLSTFSGITASAVIAICFGHSTSLSGYNVSNIESLMFIGQNTLIDVGQLLFAGIIFASLGAIMDIAMDVSSAADELRKHAPNIPPMVLFHSALNVGRDVMGTMATTLILAFFGGSLGIWVLDYTYDLPFLQLINSNSIGIEIMQGLSGSFGVILTVPIAAALSAWQRK
jgi:uncharacterized membrane protein